MDPVIKELHSTMGRMVCYLHTVEEVITMVTYMLDNSVDRTVRPFEDYDRKTLGKLMEIVRKRVPVDDEFATVFNRFLKARNRFIHDYSLTCRLYDPKEANYVEIAVFLARLQRDATKVKGVFYRYMLQGFALHDDEATEAKIVANLRSSGAEVPDNMFDSFYGPFDDPLNLRFEK